MQQSPDFGLSSVAERAVQRWEQQRQQVGPAETVSESDFCITISREAGSRGASVARLVGQELGWTVYDQGLFEYIAHEMHLRAGILESLGGEHLGWLAERLGDHWQQQDSYIVHLAKVILAIGLQGEAVIVGRGAGFVLPRERTLTVRLIGSTPNRISYVSQIDRLTPQEAERQIRETDEQRRKFVRDYFRKDNADPHEYDLVLDSSRLGEESCKELIVMALRGKVAFARRQQPVGTRVSHVPAE